MAPSAPKKTTMMIAVMLCTSPSPSPICVRNVCDPRPKWSVRQIRASSNDDPDWSADRSSGRKAGTCSRSCMITIYHLTTMKLSSTANYCANLIQVPITILNENVNLIIKTKTKKDIIIIIKDNKQYRI